jgi:hypothetical protein
VEGATGDAKTFVRLSHDPRTYFSNSPYYTRTAVHIFDKTSGEDSDCFNPFNVMKSPNASSTDANTNSYKSKVFYTALHFHGGSLNL